MGNNCTTELKEFIKNDVPIVKIKTMEEEINNTLHFLMGKSFSKKYDDQKIFINTQLTQFIKNLEYIKEEDLKELKDHQKMFIDIISKSNDKFNMLKLDSYGIFDVNKNLLELSKNLIANYYCYRIINEEKYRSRYPFIY